MRKSKTKQNKKMYICECVYVYVNVSNVINSVGSLRIVRINLAVREIEVK